MRQPEGLGSALESKMELVVPVSELKPSVSVAQPVAWELVLESELLLAVSQPVQQRGLAAVSRPSAVRLVEQGPELGASAFERPVVEAVGLEHRRGVGQDIP